MGDRNVANGSITSTQTVTMSDDTLSTVRIIVTGTWTSTLNVRVLAPDGTTWIPESVYPYGPGGSPVSSITANGQWEITGAGHVAVQVIGNTVLTGTAVVSINGGVGVAAVGIRQSTASNLNVQANTVYNASPPSPANGATVPLQSDASGNLKNTMATLLWSEDATNSTGKSTNKVVVASTYTPTLDMSFGTAVTHNSKATAAVLFGADVTNVNAAVRYFQIFNSTGGTGTVIMSFPIPAGTSTAPSRLTLGPALFGSNGVYLSTGLTWGISTTNATYTGATAAEHNVNLLYY